LETVFSKDNRKGNSRLSRRKENEVFEEGKRIVEVPPDVSEQRKKR
jgi:hypothetical protein